MPLPPAGPVPAIPASESWCCHAGDGGRHLPAAGAACLHPVLLAFHPGRAFYSPGDVSEVTVTESGLV